MQDKRDIENVVQEIMRLVQGYAEGIRQGVISEAQGDGFNQGCADFSKKKFDLIESKLRELVREPLDVQYPENYENPFACISYAAGWRASYRAHNIISTSGKVL